MKKIWQKLGNCLWVGGVLTEASAVGRGTAAYAILPSLAHKKPYLIGA